MILLLLFCYCYYYNNNNYFLYFIIRDTIFFAVDMLTVVTVLMFSAVHIKLYEASIA